MICKEKYLRNISLKIIVQYDVTIFSSACCFIYYFFVFKIKIWDLET